MAKMSDSQVPSLLMTETAAASIGTPAAGKRRLFFDTDNLLYSKDEAGATTAVGGGIPATILDAKGDLIAASAADTAAKLTAGANGKVLVAASGESTGLKWDYPPGYEFDYVERTSNLTVSATTAAGADTAITGSAVAYDGSTRVRIEAFFPSTDPTQFVLITLWDGSTDLGALSAVAVNPGTHIQGSRFLTPSNATHTYTIKAFRGTGSAVLYAASGGTSGQYLPAFLRITKA